MSTTATSATTILTAVDRCDRCSAAAKVVAVMPSGSELLFCRHHFTEHEAGLVELGATIIESAAELV
jgi:hypothetical protein